MKAQRHQQILADIRLNKNIYVTRLSEKLGVSQATIRKDLDILEQSGLLKRVHGGAVPVGHASFGNETDFRVRSHVQMEEKVSIAHLALSTIKDHDSILLDASSSCHELAKLLAKSELHLTVTTSGLATARVLSSNPLLNIYVIGGALRNSNAITGVLGAGLLSKIHIHKAFVSARGVDVQRGLMDFSFEEGQLKSFMLENISEVYALIDHTKIGEVSVASFCPLSRVTTVFTDSLATPDQISMLTTSGVHVEQAHTLPLEDALGPSTTTSELPKT